MYGLQKFKEFINDLGSTINEFASIPNQHGPHHSRDAQLRRRSSWSDISSFFKFNKGPSRTGSGAEDSENEQAGASSTMKPLPASTSAVVASKPSASGYGKVQQKGKPLSLSRSPSLRINSNGNVIPTSSKHRRVPSNMHLLQYDSINKSSSVRYQPNKSGMTKAIYINSAPPNPKANNSGLTPPSRQNPEYRGQNPTSPSPRRINASPNLTSSSLRRPTPHTPSNFTEQNIRDHNFHNSSKQYSNNDPRQENRYEVYQSHDPRTRTLSDSRKHPVSQHQGRQELSKENLDNFNYYGSMPYEASDRRELHRDNSSRLCRSNQETGTIPIHIDNRYILPPDERYHTYDQRSSHPHENRIDNRQIYPPHSVNSNFRPVEGYAREIQGHHSNDRFDHEYRAPNPEYSGNHVPTSGPKVGSLYRKDYGNHSNDNNMLGRDGFHMNKMIPGDPHKRELRHGSPRNSHSSALVTGGEQYSSNTFISADNELLNGAPSQQYYESMISQINNQIARVSEGGASSQQPFNTHFQKPLPPPDDDDNEWC